MNYQEICEKYGLKSLTDADLRDADLTDADLIGADLRGADLRGADLTGANLRNANLTGADLTDANLTDAILVNAKGLATKEQEMASAKKILDILNSGGGQSGIDTWHTHEASEYLCE